MKRVGSYFKRIGEYFISISYKTYITIVLEAIGLFANLIAILTFFGAINTPKDSSNFYINSQEFLVWSLIGLIYMLGLISSRFKRRWRKRMLDKGFVDRKLSWGTDLFTSTLRQKQFGRDLAFTLAFTFPLSFLYIRAFQASITEGTASPWSSLGFTVLLWIPATFCIMIASNIFDWAFSLYEGD